MATVPIIIPFIVILVALVAIILIIYRVIQKLFGCPHQKSSYPIYDEDIHSNHLRKSVLPSSPYSIDPVSESSNNSTASPNSVYYKGAALLYPALAAPASAPSRTPSPGRINDDDDQTSKSRDHQQPEHIGLDTVDQQIGSLVDSPSPNSSNTTREETHHFLTIHSTDSSSPEHMNNFNNHFESDV